MADFKINSRKTTPEDFKRLGKALQLGPKASEMKDKNLDSSEIYKLLESNEQNGLQLEEVDTFLNRVGAEQFATIDTILQRHGFNVWTRISNYSEFLENSDPDYKKRNAYVRIIGTQTTISVESRESSIKRQQLLDKLLDAYIKDTRSFSIADKAMITKLWPRIQVRMRELGMTVLADMKTPEDLDKAYRQVTDFPERVHSLYILDKLLNEKFDPSDKRPIALVISTKWDNNGALHTQVALDELINSGKFRVIYREAGQVSDIRDALAGITQHYHQPSDVVIISAHGSADGIRLSDRPISGNTEDTGPVRLTIDDIANLGLAAAISPQGQLVLASCNNAKYPEEDTTLINVIARELPRGVRIIGNTGAGHTSSFKIGKGNQIQSDIDGGEEDPGAATYVIHGKKR